MTIRKPGINLGTIAFVVMVAATTVGAIGPKKQSRKLKPPIPAVIPLGCQPWAHVNRVMYDSAILGGTCTAFVDFECIYRNRTQGCVFAVGQGLYRVENGVETLVEITCEEVSEPCDDIQYNRHFQINFTDTLPVGTYRWYVNVFAGHCTAPGTFLHGWFVEFPGGPHP